jgi:hypothetical protein
VGARADSRQLSVPNFWPNKLGGSTKNYTSINYS